MLIKLKINSDLNLFGMKDSKYMKFVLNYYLLQETILKYFYYTPLLTTVPCVETSQGEIRSAKQEALNRFLIASIKAINSVRSLSRFFSTLPPCGDRDLRRSRSWPRLCTDSARLIASAKTGIVRLSSHFSSLMCTFLRTIRGMIWQVRKFQVQN